MEFKKSGQDAIEMTISSLVFPTLGSVAVCALCYFLGRNEFSMFWLLLLVAFNMAKSYLWRKRESRLMSLRAARMHEREVITAQLSDLPAWVQFPDTERVEWLNKVIQQLWPYIGEYSKVFMTEVILPQVKSQMPPVFKSFKFTKMDVGDMGCRVGGIKVYTHNVGRDRIIVDMDVAYAGDADFSISCCGFTGGMNQIQFSGKLRCILKPLLPYPPMIGGVSMTFLEMPNIDFNLTGMGEMVEIPGLFNAIRAVVNSQVAALCVIPNEIVVPLAPNVDVTQLFFPEPNGVIRLRIVEAKNLENKDISVLFKKGKSDPYCEIQVGSQYFKTKTIDNSLNPIWNETFEAVVDQADGQQLRIECFDEDPGQKDEELGRLSIPLSLLRQKAVIDKWYPLEGCKHGDIRVKAAWLSLSSLAADVEREEWQAEWKQGDKPVHAALLMIFIDNISDLPYPKAKLEPSPYVKVTLGMQSQQTAFKPKTVNPLFQNRFHFFVKNPAGQQLKIEALDEGTQRLLGSLTLPLSSLLKEPKLELYQQTLMLTHGVHQSPLVATIRLRGLVPQPKQVRPQDLEHETLAHYATGSYIERASGVQQEKGGIDGMELRNDKGLVEEWDGMDNTLEHSMDIPSPSSEVSRSPINGMAHLREKKMNGSSLSVSSESRSRSRLGRLFKASRKHKTMDCPEVRAEIEMSIRYVDPVAKLEVRVLNGRYVDEGVAACLSVSLYTLSKKLAERRKTAVVHHPNPVFDNHFEFDVAKSDLSNYKLELKLKDIRRTEGVMGRKRCVGMVEFRLEELPSFTLPQQWVRLLAEQRD